MGSGSSKYTEGSLRQAADLLAAKTKPTRDIVNVLFKFMMRELKISDFYKLTSREECDKYVAFLGSRLQPLFYELKVIPSKGKDGTIYFQKISKFQRPSEADAGDRKNICLFIAFFYIRIFQIFGALALTLNDDVRSFLENGVFQTGPEYIASLNQYDLQLGDPLGTVGEPYGQRSIQSGGADVVPIEGKTSGNNQAETVLGDTELRFLLSPTLLPTRTEGVKEIKVLYSGDNLSSKRISFAFRIIANIYVNVNKPSSENSLVEESKGFFLFVLPDVTRRLLVIQLPFTSEMAESDSVKIKFDDTMIVCTYKKFVKMPTESVYNVINGILQRPPESKTFTLARDSTNNYIVQNISSVVNFKTVLQLIFSHLFKSINEITQKVEQTSEQQTKIDVPEETYERSINERQQGRRNWNTRRNNGINYRRRIYQQPTRRNNSNSKLDQFMLTDTRAPPALRLSGMIKSIGSVRTLSPGVSRALRLLLSSQEGSEWKTAICDSKFLTDRAGNHDGAPSIGKTLDSSPVLVALEALFYTTVRSNNDISMSKESYGLYSKFLMELTKLYTGTSTTVDPKERPLAKIKSTQSACANKITTVHEQNLEDTWTCVKKLINLQIRHSEECGKFLRELFFIKREKRGSLYISIHPSIVKGGSPQLDYLTEKARDILVKYTKDCEALYREGVNAITNRGSVVPVVPGTGTVVPGPPRPGPPVPVPGPPRDPDTKMLRNTRRVSFATGGRRCRTVKK